MVQGNDWSAFAGVFGLLGRSPAQGRIKWCDDVFPTCV